MGSPSKANKLRHRAHLGSYYAKRKRQEAQRNISNPQDPVTDKSSTDSPSKSSARNTSPDDRASPSRHSSSSRSKPRKPKPKPEPKPRGPAEVYDLDDPRLQEKLQPLFDSLSSRKKSKQLQEITCKFLAAPINEPHCFTRQLSQYGNVLCEDRKKLIMRLRPEHVESVRQIWVSKYLTPFVKCNLTIRRGEKSAWKRPEMNQSQVFVIVQRVLEMAGRKGKDTEKRKHDGSDDGHETIGEEIALTEATASNIDDGADVPRKQKRAREEDTAVEQLPKRRRAISLPLPRDMDKLRQSLYHKPQIMD